MKQRLRSLYQLSRRPRSIRIANQDGKMQAEGYGNWHSYLRDPYHLMLVIPWSGFILVVGIVYVFINIIFALMYLAGGDCLQGGRVGSFEDAFFFSVHTFASIGYGVIAPKTTYANFIVLLEAISSLLSIAVVTGLSFARFSKPHARVTFSQYAVITSHHGIPTLMFRAANQRRNLILEAQLRVYLLQDEITPEGEYYYRIYDLQLQRSRSPSFALTWTAMHPITEESPLYAATPESLSKKHAQIIISLTGTDETVAYTINLRHVYSANEVLFNHRLMDIIYKSPNGDRYFEYTNFHKVIPIHQEATGESDRNLGVS
ncbi:ion channel [Calothrix sp. 336/3]|uniref:ion channel n=1 Tax=Calothrix sp. 336/3 TaxID=1337936 RepID=UPI0004E46219|nr:ion channel [Calothrix sp. 336/3]AKG23374.1 ATP-sensitive inward rectifier potassium channel 10 [Calothrix sp. 336/3]